MDSICKFINKDYNGQSGNGACYYNEDNSNKNTGYGCGNASDELCNNGAGRDGIYRVGGGEAKGCNGNCGYTINNINLNGLYR